MIIRWVVLLAVLSLSQLVAFDESPWFTRFYEIYPSIEYRFQDYPSLDSCEGCPPYSGTDHFLTFGLGATLCLPKDWETPTRNCSIQAEFTLAQTKSQGGMHANDVQLLLRHPLTDSILGDFADSTVGVKIIQNSRAARRDIGYFAHGGIGLEGQVAVGKEFAPHAEWVFRGWALAGVGVADTGSPWLRAEGHLETQYCNFWQNALIVESLFGWGGDCLCQECFTGYGSVRHESVDIGWKTKLLIDRANLQGGVYYRVFAKNCPKNAVQVIAKVEFPFGL